MGLLVSPRLGNASLSFKYSKKCVPSKSVHFYCLEGIVPCTRTRTG